MVRSSGWTEAFWLPVTNNPVSSTSTALTSAAAAQFTNQNISKNNWLPGFKKKLFDKKVSVI
jgi:hypothetical protein